MRTASYLITLVLGLAMTLGAVPAQAETTLCNVITVPTTITAPGVYCLNQDFATNLASGAAITIAANNVVVDLNAHRLGNLQAGPGTAANGIRADNRQNITIKNGTAPGFFRGIVLTGDGHVVEDIRADQNTFVGIEVHGDGNLIRNNQVVATGGSSSSPEAFGIVVSGTGPRVLNNDVIDVQKQGFGTARGIIFSTTVSGGLAVNNRITNADVGIEFTAGSTGKYRDNLTTNVPVGTRFVGGTDAGGND